MALLTTRDLKTDVLFRASESITGSGWDDKVVDYLNRVYGALALGSSEYLPEHVPDWWWMRSSAVLTLEPVNETGTVQVAQGDVNIAFSEQYISSRVGWKLKIDGHPDIFTIATHSPPSFNMQLDSPYTGESNSTATYRLLKTTYALDDDVATLLSPMISYRGSTKIIGMAPERMDGLYPLSRLGPGEPLAFALEDEGTVRFSHGGRTDGMSMRVEYRYKPVLTTLTDDVNSIPLVPVQYRHVLADMALVYVMVDKNDNRANSLITSSRSILTAMYNENKHRLSQMDDTLGWIFPRQGYNSRLYPGPLRTESGLIIG